jgi:hypothetical protein
MKKFHPYIQKLQNWLPTIVKVYVELMILLTLTFLLHAKPIAFIFQLYWIAYPFFILAIIYAIAYIITKAFHYTHINSPSPHPREGGDPCLLLAINFRK